ncbi:hypothetical protein AUK42_04640 [Candidatus Atribacteria bacterium CG2_30_33_13]|uniref:Uncharacterized protein n=1 Tax=Candidatus Infernicultor aquiphilus TaxID=1805029 RepID=A0A1J5GQ88_9BACT|nr:MAG: hypothetical protein AUK42_04640 [Candidatus Atribacteria bacterium CG2_30_33_13]
MNRARNTGSDKSDPYITIPRSGRGQVCLLFGLQPKYNTFKSQIFKKFIARGILPLKPPD